MCIRKWSGIEDAGHSPRCEANVTAARLGSALDEHHPELGLTPQAVRHHPSVARLEHPQRQADVGKEHAAEREHGQNTWFTERKRSQIAHRRGPSWSSVGASGYATSASLIAFPAATP